LSSFGHWTSDSALHECKTSAVFGWQILHKQLNKVPQVPSDRASKLCQHL